MARKHIANSPEMNRARADFYFDATDTLYAALRDYRDDHDVHPNEDAIQAELDRLNHELDGIAFA